MKQAQGADMGADAFAALVSQVGRIVDILETQADTQGRILDHIREMDGAIMTHEDDIMKMRRGNAKKPRRKRGKADRPADNREG